MIYSICVDNCETIMIPPLSISWKTPYLNLQFNREKARQMLFADNGRNWQYGDTDSSFRTLLLDISLDENDHIVGLSTYKYKSTSFHHGRNSSAELKVTAADIKALLTKLDEVVTNHSGEELENLITVISQSHFGKERQFNVRKADMTLLDENGTKQTIKRNALLKALQISHTYLEVLKNDRAFRLCPKEFPQEIHGVMHELLSFVNTDHYYKIDELKYNMSMRELIADAEANYPLLREAVLQGNLQDVKRLAKYAKLVPYECQEGSPLYHAVKNNQNEIAKVLLENGAYVLEIERDGSHYPLETAYQNGNRDLVKLLIKYHGAKIKNYMSCEYNTKNLLKLCADNKDYEILRLISPDAFSRDAQTWLTPDMFPDMEEDTIDALCDIENLRIVWPLSLVQPIYEKKNYDLCKRMLVHGTNSEVVEFFTVENNYEFFDCALQCHPDLGAFGSYELVFERGGKWYETLSDYTSNLFYYRERYFANLLNNGDVKHYLEIMEKQDYPFYGLDGYILWPEKITDPEPYINLLRIYMNKMPKGKGRGRLLFLDDIIRFFGDEAIAKEYYGKYPLEPDTEWGPFLSYTIVSRYIRDNSTKNPYAGAEMIRSFFQQELENKDNKAYGLFSELVTGCNLWRPLEAETDEQKLYGNERNSQYMLQALLDCVPLQKLDTIVKQKEITNEVESAYQYAVRYGKNIRNINFLDMLKEGQRT